MLGLELGVGVGYGDYSRVLEKGVGGESQTGKVGWVKGSYSCVDGYICLSLWLFRGDGGTPSR